MELREGFCHAFLVVDHDRAIGTKGGDLQGHDHAVVVVRCVVSAPEKAGNHSRSLIRSRSICSISGSTPQQALCETVSLDDHYVSIDRCLDSHLGQHPDDRLRSVALLVGEASHTGKTACALTECREDRNDREEVRTVGCIYAESLQRSTLDSDVSLVSVKLRKAGSRVHEYVHDREVCLK